MAWTNELNQGLDLHSFVVAFNLRMGFVQNNKILQNHLFFKHWTQILFILGFERAVLSFSLYYTAVHGIHIMSSTYSSLYPSTLSAVRFLNNKWQRLSNPYCKTVEPAKTCSCIIYLHWQIVLQTVVLWLNEITAVQYRYSHGMTNIIQHRWVGVFTSGALQHYSIPQPGL